MLRLICLWMNQWNDVLEHGSSTKSPLSLSFTLCVNDINNTRCSNQGGAITSSDTGLNGQKKIVDRFRTSEFGYKYNRVLDIAADFAPDAQCDTKRVVYKESELELKLWYHFMAHLVWNQFSIRSVYFHTFMSHHEHCLSPNCRWIQYVKAAFF